MSWSGILPSPDKRLCRVAWEDPDNAERWCAIVETAQDRNWKAHVAALASGLATPVVVAIRPFELPLLLRAGRDAGLCIRSLGTKLPAPWRGLFALGPVTGEAWCAVLPAPLEGGFDTAWREQDYGAAARILGVPDCCIQRAAELGTGELRFDLMAAPAYRWLPMGVAPGRHLPCKPDCLHALTASGEARLAPLDALPSRFSAIVGVAELITPAFQLIFGCTPEVEISSPDENPKGIAPWHEGRGFGNLRRARIADVSALPDQALVIPDMTADWPALDLWRREWLDARLGDTAVGRFVVPANGEEYSFAQFTGELFTSDDPIYLFSLPFADRAADMRRDYSVPPVFETALASLPDEYADRYCGELFLGAAGTSTHLHQDILRVGFWMTVIWGRKRWALCAPSGDPADLTPDTDLFDPVVRAHLANKGIEVFLMEQNAGDTVYLPPGWWHQVENPQRTLSLAEMVVDPESGDTLLARVSEVEDEISAEAAAVFRQAAQLAKDKQTQQARTDALMAS